MLSRQRGVSSEPGFGGDGKGESKMVERQILNSWKEIASYLGRGVRTVQRWEAQLGLPVHRPSGRDHSAVLAFSSELDRWLDSRPVRQPQQVASESSVSGISTAELEALLARAEILLEKLESLLLRSEDMQQRLSLSVNTVANGQIGRDIRSEEILPATRAEAA